MELSEIYKSLFENSHSIMLIINPDTGDIEDANHAASNYYGYTKDEITSMKITDINTLSEEEVLEEIGLANEEQRNYFNFRHRLSYGKIRDVEVHSGPIYIHGKKLLYSIIHNVTEKKQTEDELRASEEKFRTLFDYASDCIMLMKFVKGKELIIADVNAATCEMHGYSKEELVGSPISMLDDPETAEHIPERAKRMLSGESLTFEGKHVRKDGSVFPVEISSCMFNIGKDKYVLAIDRDITGRKQIERSLIRERSAAEYERAKSDAILASLGDAVSIQTRDFKVIFQNDIHKSMIGEHLGEFCFKAYEGKDAVCDGCPVEETFNDGEVHTVIRSLEMDGKVRYFEITASSIKDPAGNISVGIEVVREITERKQMEDELRQALNDKDLLMREVHHRVKNNLSLQMQDISDDKSKAYFVDARNRVKSMTMIHEMLHRSGDITRLSSPEFIRKFVKTLFSNYKIKTNHIKLQYDIDDIELDADTMIPLGLIINELVSNALKYAFPDGMKGTLGISMKRTGKGNYELAIKDTGVGLPEDFDIQKVTSLGLMIVDSLVSQIKGTMEVSGSDGTEFRIIFSERAVP